MAQNPAAGAPPRRKTPYRVLCVAGTDSSGCSGIAADLKTVTALGGHALPAVTAVTAQDTHAVLAVAAVPARLVRAQIEAAAGDAGVDAVKVGMLARASIVGAVAASLGRLRGVPVVLDPVVRSTTGGELLDESGRRALVERLLPLVDLLTPNLPEAEALLGRPVAGTIAAMAAAARELRTLGPRAVLIKGGHRRGAPVDVCVDASGTAVFRGPRIAGANTRGTGCVLSTACACFLARGLPLAEAVRRAKAFTADAIRGSYPLGSGRGPVSPAPERGALRRRTA